MSKTAETPLWRQPGLVSLLAIALLAELAYAVLNISAMPVYLKNDRGFPEGTIALIVATFLFSEAVFKGPMGWMADRFGRKRMVVLGPVLTVFTAVGSLFVPRGIGDLEVYVFFALRVVDGLAVAMIWPAAFALVGETVGESQKQEAMSLLNMCYLGGVALALLVGGIADDLFGQFTQATTGHHAPSLYLASFLCAGIAIFSYIKLPSGRAMREAARTAEHATLRKWSFKSQWETAKKIPGYLVLGAVTFMGVGFPIAVVKLFAQDEFDMSGTKFGSLVLPAMIAMAALSPFMSKYGERIGKHRAVHLGLALCSVGMAVIGLAAFLPGFRNLLLIGLAGIPVGLGFLLTIPAWYASVSEIDEASRASNIGAVMTSQGLGAIVGSLIGGQAYQRFHGIGKFAGIKVDASFAHYSPFVGCAVCVIAGWLLSYWLLRR
ncbi:MAG TPA: MFS transporter [Fimbriimonadaceae bacterium]|nr:MFS transporter [Fimbriimonadaceae bacterium]